MDGIVGTVVCFHFFEQDDPLGDPLRRSLGDEREKRGRCCRSISREIASEGRRIPMISVAAPLARCMIPGKHDLVSETL